MKVLIIEDEKALRSTMAAFLTDAGHVCELACDHASAREKLGSYEYDVILLDITLPGLNGMEVARQITAMGGTTRILMLSMHAGPEYVARALAAGASGYLVKDSAFEELATALEVLWSGRRYLGKAIDAQVVEQLLANQQAEQPELAVLTPRQRQILQLIAEGSGTRDIAERLSLSVKTVETHRSQLMERLHIHDVPGLVRLAIKLGLVTPDR